MPSGHYTRDRHKFKPNTRSGYRGVLYVRRTPPLSRPWKAYIVKNGMQTGLGYYATPEEAAAAYNAEALRYHGPDTYLNVIGQPVPYRPEARVPPPLGERAGQDPRELLRRGLEVLREMRQAGGDSLKTA